MKKRSSSKTGGLKSRRNLLSVRSRKPMTRRAKSKNPATVSSHEENWGSHYQ